MKHYWPTDEGKFISLAKTHNVVSVSAKILADLETPVSVYAKIVGDAEGFLLESVEQGQRWSRYSFVGKSSLGRVTHDDSGIQKEGILQQFGEAGMGIFELLELVTSRLKVAAPDDHPPLTSGLIGYLGYDTVRELEDLASVKADARGLPIAQMSLIGDVCAFDHFEQSITLVSNVFVKATDSDEELANNYAKARRRLNEMAAAIAEPRTIKTFEFPRSPTELPKIVRNQTSEEYVAKVEVAKELIAQGDIFQVVLSQRFDFHLACSSFTLYRALRASNPSPYMYFIRTPEMDIVGSSPEALVKLEKDRVVTRPIAGTRPRGSTEEEDKRLIAELIENPKELAEHVMLVDLARNDVGRISKFATETVDELMTVEKYSSVIHITSQVSAQLRDGLGPFDVLKATIPAGTVSGSPKVRAMQIIDELEPTRRGPYAGVVGYIDLAGNLDVAIAIRTLFVDRHGNAYMQAGAGIVADSDPWAEDAECLNKAKSILAIVALLDESGEA